jgi:hypothetical protein
MILQLTSPSLSIPSLDIFWVTCISYCSPWSSGNVSGIVVLRDCWHYGWEIITGMKLQRECKLPLGGAVCRHQTVLTFLYHIAVVLTTAVSLVLGINNIYDVASSDILLIACSVEWRWLVEKSKPLKRQVTIQVTDWWATATVSANIKLS